MGLMRFVVPPDCMTDETVKHAYLTGYDRVPWQVRVRRADGQLLLERAVSESAALHVPWHVKGHGQLTLSTGTLMERPEPYWLPLELARGKVSQIRNQVAEWQAVGLDVPRKLLDGVAEAVAFFAQATVTAHASAKSSKVAAYALKTALDVGDALADLYAEQAVSVRRHLAQKLPVLLGADLGTALLDEETSRRYLNSFNAAGIPLVWREIEPTEGNFRWEVVDRQIEWSAENGLKICGGPLLRFDKHSFPGWLYLYEDDFESLMSCVTAFVKAVVKRYQGQIGLWQCAGRINNSDVLSLGEEEKVRLAARAVELTRAIDPETPTLVCFDQPWAEYLSSRELDFPPLHFADALIRSGLGLRGIALEINMGYQPGGTLLRDPLEFNRHLDHWSQLGVPFYVKLSVPSSRHDDPLARGGVQLVRDGWTVESQRAWVARHVPLLLAKSYVHGILWNQLCDSQPHEFPHGGLFDHQGRAKPALEELASIRRAHLK